MTTNTHKTNCITTMESLTSLTSGRYQFQETPLPGQTTPTDLFSIKLLKNVARIEKKVDGKWLKVSDVTYSANTANLLLRVYQSKVAKSGNIDKNNNTDYSINSTGNNANKPTKGVKTMTLHQQVNVSKVEEALKASGYIQDKDGIFEKGEMRVKFTEKTARLVKGNLNQTIHLDKATNGSIVKCVVSLMNDNKVLKHVNVTTTPATQPAAPAAQPVNISPEREITGKPPEVAPKPKAKAKAKAPKPEPVAPKSPVNPNVDGTTPIFDLLQNAVSATETAEQTIASVWVPIAKRFGYSVTPLMEALHAEGRWTDKTDKNGKVKVVDGMTVPEAYKKVYEAEKENGIKGAGHYINKAARMFTHHNPDSKKNKGKTDATNTANAQASNETPEKLIEQLERAAVKLSKLSPADLKSWLESSATMAPILDMIDEDKNILSAL